MSVREYVSFLRTRPFGQLVAVSLVSRLPMSMISLAIALMITRSGDFRAAGLVIASFVVGQTISGPILGRAVDRFGRSRVLRPVALVQGALLVLLATLSTNNLPGLIACAAAAGLATPPMMATIRGLWTDVVPEEQRGTVFALEAMLQEVAFLTGPMLVALLTAVASPRITVAAIGLTVVIGVFLFTAHPQTRVRVSRAATGESKRPRRLMRLPLSLLLTAVVSNVAFASGELATVAFARDLGAPAAAGLLIAIWSAGSLVAGVLWGPRVARGGRLVRRLFLIVALLAASVALPAVAESLAVFALLMIPAGLLIAPLFAVLYATVAAKAPPGAETESFAWLASAFQFGSVVGPPLGGFVVDARGFRYGFLFASVSLAVMVLPLLATSLAMRDRAEEAVPTERSSGEPPGA